MLRAHILLGAEGHALEPAEQLLLEAADGFRRFQSPWMELRATLDLARIALQTGRHAEARARLAALYGGFSEGFDRKQLREARTLLDQLNV